MYLSCVNPIPIKPKPINPIYNTTWQGQIYRNSDDKQLSEIKLKISNDTLYLFSNAIFGVGNDTLILQKKSDNKQDDSLLCFSVSSGEVMQLKYKYAKTERGENLSLIGNDFYITLSKSNSDIFSQDALSFYKNKTVPREAFMYLDGAYEGEAEADNSITNAYISSIGGMKMKLVFLDGFKVKIIIKMPMLDIFSNGKSNSEIVNYTIKGHRVYLGSKKNMSSKGMEVKNSGKTLVIESDKGSMILHKLY